MTDMAGIAGNAVSVYQQALSTVSNNIANVSTDGYSRQDVSLSALPVTKSGNVFLGSGVAMDRVKRQYDAFVESNLRNTTSDLKAQGPMVSYANRVVDVLGSSTMGLNTALDAFFASARTLSGDPSSTVLRSSFVRDAQGVADRFGQLSAQLDLVQDETQHEVDNSVSQINALTSQIAKVNIQLAKQKSEDAQPPDLLDQRDLLLKQLSDFARINTRFTPNGIVTVSFGPTINADVVVDGQKALMIQANYDGAASPEKLALVLDPYGKATALNGISSGSLAGIMTFRDQVLGSSRNALDGLAKTFANEVNTLHQQGIDGYGNPGQALFSFDSSIPNAAGAMRVAFEDPLRVAAGAQFRVVEGAENPSGTNASISYDEKPAASPGAAAAAPPPGPAPLQSVIPNSGNVSTARQVNVSASLGVAGVATIANGMQDVSLYLDSMQAGQQLQIYTRDGRHLLGTPVTDSIALDNLNTKDNGFAGGATLSDDYLNASGVSATGAAVGYKGMEIFYGAQASVQAQPIFDGKDAVSGYNYLPAVLQGSRLSPLTANTMNPPLGYFPAGAFKLNGQDLGQLDPPVGAGPLQASAVANWINQARATTGVTAKASNVIVVKPEQLKFGMPLYFGTTKVETAGANTPQALARAINNANANVQATVNAGGELVISNAEGHTGEDISISATASNSSGILSLTALGMGATTFRGQVELVKPAVEPIVVDTSKINVSNGLLINGQAIEFPAGLGAPMNRAKLLAIANAINDQSGVTDVTARLSADSNSLILGSIAQGSDPKIVVTGAVALDANGIPQVDPNQMQGNQYVYGANALGISNGAWPAPQVNEITVKADQLKFGNPLYFKDAGKWIRVNTAGATTVQDMAQAINTANAGVNAQINADGNLVISNAADRVGGDIRISASPSDATGTSSLTALGMSANTFKVQIKVTPSGPIQLGFGSTGTPSDLAQLGFRTGAFITGAVKDDLLVFVSGPGNAAVSASYAGKPVDAKQNLRAQTLEVKFLQDPAKYNGALYYTISSTDPSNKALGATVVAERVFDPTQLNPGVRFQGLNLAFTAAPHANDVFKLDGNQDGLGNNDNMLALAGLETKAVVGNKTLTNSYIDQVNEMGNIARQATISQTALTVVHDQAVKSRDEISGVSLDKEAADLIRYQQAYQASAKVLQVAGQLFDAVLRV